MKKLALILSLALGTSLASLAQDAKPVSLSFKDMAVFGICKKESFGKCFYNEYHRIPHEGMRADTIGGYLKAYYDFDGDFNKFIKSDFNGADVLAYFKPDSSFSTNNCDPKKVNQNAEIIMIDIDGDKIYDLQKIDTNNDGKFDEIILFITNLNQKYGCN